MSSKYPPSRLPSFKGRHHSEKTRALLSRAMKSRLANGEELKIGGVANCPEKVCVLCTKVYKPVSGCQKVCKNCGVRTCRKCEREFTLRKPSVLLIGKGKFCSKECEKTKLLGNVPWNKGLGNLTEAQRARKSIEWKKMRKLVFERDNYTCVLCNIRGGILHPDHIKPKAMFPELMFDLSNVRTLCRECHKKTDTYGSKAYKFKREAVALHAEAA